MTRLYVAGPMSGIEGMNFPAFNEAANQLRAAGYDVENPADFGVADGWVWADYLKRDIPLMLACDGVATLEGWASSPGASLEVGLAWDLAMPAESVRGWLLCKAVA